MATRNYVFFMFFKTSETQKNHRKNIDISMVGERPDDMWPIAHRDDNVQYIEISLKKHKKNYDKNFF